jgi:hypothetical protein
VSSSGLHRALLLFSAAITGTTKGSVLVVLVIDLLLPPDTSRAVVDAVLEEEGKEEE